ncbi:phage integrase family protein [Curtobacterium sp. AG1037]|nr:phage integrase family protein [Curtobacterium sp. AG1037]
MQHFPKLTPHDLRHTAASLGVSAGATVPLVQGMLGHAKPSITLDVYTGLFPADFDPLVTKLGDLASGAGIADRL